MNIRTSTKNTFRSSKTRSMRSFPSPMEVLLSDLLLFPSSTAANDADPVGQVATSSSSAFGWPRLGGLQLSAERLDARNRGIGGSDANVILSGDAERVLRLWQEKRGEAEPEDLSGRLSVVLGCWTEAFNRQWYEKLSGNSGDRCRQARSPAASIRWRKCTLDGRGRGERRGVRGQAHQRFVKPEDVLERYMPQLQHNMAVAKADRAVLSVIFGNARYEMFEVAADWLYQLDLLEAEKAFWNAVLSGEPPAAWPRPRPRGPSPRANSASRATMPGPRQRPTGSRPPRLRRPMRRRARPSRSCSRTTSAAPSGTASRQSAARPARSPSGSCK